MFRESATSFEIARDLGVVDADGLARASRSSDGRHFLFVSAPFGPFCRELAEALRESGARSTRVILNAGDALDWGVTSAATYFGGRSGWTGWLYQQIRRLGVTDIVTYGDSSPYAVDALILAQSLGLRRHVLEQGYFRPDWVTLERDGVNGNSRLPRNPEWYLRHAAARDDAPAAEQRVGLTTPSAVYLIVRHHAAIYAGALLFPRYRAAYQHSAFRQAMSHCWRFVVGRLKAERARRAHEALVATSGPIFLALLQRPGDSQLWRHSNYETAGDFVEHVVTSFAAHAPDEAQLVIRPHPLDPGLDDHGAMITRIAAREGVAGRVHYLDHGKLHEVLPRVEAVVCVNSTAGLSAVEFGKPTVTLGKAIYDMAGLTHQGGLDRLWTNPEAPDAELYDAFRRVLMATSQVNGAYATPFGRRLAAGEMSRRLMRAVA
jgi:capsular polysaccharide export protein